MIIKSAKTLADWAEAAAGAMLPSDPDLRVSTVGAICSVVWRHARGQGLELGHDWGWVLELYTPQKLAEIVAEAAKIHGSGFHGRG